MPGEEELTLEVRGYFREAGEELVKPLLTEEPLWRGDAGEFIIRMVVAKPEDSRGAEVKVVIPYAAMSLPPGEYEMGYEIRSLHGYTIDFVRATAFVPMRVTDRTRKTMVERSVQRRSTTEKIERVAYILKDGELEEAKVQLDVAMPVQEGARTILQVDISGEFSHPAPVKLPAPMPHDPSVESLPLGDVAWQSLDQFEPESKRLVYFATNRNVVNAALQNADRFGNELADLTYGTCLINIPIETHTSGKLEVPGWWQRRKPEKHFLVETVTVLERSQFLAATDASDVLLFVHGYNTRFDFSVLRMAQLVHDLKFPGRGIAFSWPSAATLTGYFQDEKMNEASVGALVEVLQGLVAARDRGVNPVRRIHVISHSMGNRLFLKAVRQLELEFKNSEEALRPIFGHVALAAPDVDATTFSALLPSVIRQAEHVTFYYCESDRALGASRAIHVDKPVGLGPFFADGMDTINADRVNTEILGHGYFASAHQLLLDLALLLRFNLGPDERHPPLSIRSEYFGYPHWTLALP
jgi:esterase/lipase superfamily enzyme